jgi:hypothetical protein
MTVMTTRRKPSAATATRNVWGGEGGMLQVSAGPLTFCTPIYDAP